MERTEVLQRATQRETPSASRMVPLARSRLRENLTVRPHNGYGVRSTSRTNRTDGRLQDVSLSGGSLTTPRWAPSLAAQEPLSRFRSKRDRRRIWRIDWPHAASNADAELPPRPQSRWALRRMLNPCCNRFSASSRRGCRHTLQGRLTSMSPLARCDGRLRGLIACETASQPEMCTVKSWLCAGWPSSPKLLSAFDEHAEVLADQPPSGNAARRAMIRRRSGSLHDGARRSTSSWVICTRSLRDCWGCLDGRGYLNISQQPGPLLLRGADAVMRRLRFSGQWDKLRADRSKEA